MANPRKQFESAWPHGKTPENEGRVDAETALHSKFAKIEHPDFAQGRDRLIEHVPSGRIFRSRIEVVSAQNACPECSAVRIHEGAPLLAPIRVSVVECDENGTPLRNEDGSLKTEVLMSHAIASANTPSPERWAGAKRLVRNTILEAIHKAHVERDLFAENLGDGVSHADLVRAARAAPINAELAAELEQVRSVARTALARADEQVGALRQQLIISDGLLGQSQARINELEQQAARDRARITELEGVSSNGS